MQMLVDWSKEEPQRAQDLVGNDGYVVQVSLRMCFNLRSPLVSDEPASENDKSSHALICAPRVGSDLMYSESTE